MRPAHGVMVVGLGRAEFVYTRFQEACGLDAGDTVKQDHLIECSLQCSFRARAVVADRESPRFLRRVLVDRRVEHDCEGVAQSLVNGFRHRYKSPRTEAVTSTRLRQSMRGSRRNHARWRRANLTVRWRIRSTCSGPVIPPRSPRRRHWPARASPVPGTRCHGR